MTPLLASDCVHKQFRGNQVLTSASFRCHPGEIRVLLGRNGCGKSTLFRITVGLLKPDAGSIRFAGAYFPRPSLARLARLGVFFLPESGLPTLGLTVRHQLQLIGAAAGSQFIQDGIRLAGIGSLLESKGAALSGGEQRRVACALAIARRPRCLLADEPFRGLAPRDIDIVTESLRTLASSGCAIGVTGHEVSQLFAVADQVTWCAGGRTLEIGSPAEARSRDDFRRAYLGALDL